MAKGVINLQKESGGIVKISPVDGTGITEVTVPESGELVTKAYADLKVALASFVGTNQNLTGNGYQKLPGGLIIQWGESTAAASSHNVTWPVTFPNSCFQAFATDRTTSAPLYTITVHNSLGSSALSGATFYSSGSFSQFSWFAIGY